MKKIFKHKNYHLITSPAENINRSFLILDMILELKLSLYKSLYSDKSLDDLKKMINREMVERKLKYANNKKFRETTD